MEKIMAAIICNIQQYNVPIAELRQQAKALIREANHTHENGKLMAINIKYRHVERNLHFTIQDQQACFEVESYAERQWYKTHGPGELNEPETNQNCHQYTASILNWHNQLKYATSMSAVAPIHSLINYLIQHQQDCYIANHEANRTDKYWKWYHYEPSQKEN